MKMTIAAMVVAMMVVLVVQVQSEIRSPPVIEEPTRPMSKFRTIGSTISTKCQAKGNPTPKYEWLYSKDGTSFGDMVTSFEPGPTVSFNDVTGTLTILQLNVAVDGYYTCRAYNDYSNGKRAIAVASSVYVRTVYNPDVKNSTAAAVVTVEAFHYHYSTMRCINNFHESLTLGTTYYKWYYHYYLTNVDPLEEIIPNERIFIDVQGNIHFAYTMMTDAESNRQYTCAITKGILKDIEFGEDMILDVKSSEPASYMRSPPALKYPISHDGKPAVFTYILDDLAKLECFFYGYFNVENPYVNTSWRMGPKQTTVVRTEGRYTLSKYNRTLSIKRVQESDDGEYTCVGINPSPNGIATGRVYLNVTSKPIWVKELQTVTVTEGEDGVLYCDARSLDGEYAPTLPVWYINGDLLTSTLAEDNLHFSNDNKRVTITSTSKDNILCLQCMVKNSVGTLFGNGCLRVLAPIVITRQPSLTQVLDDAKVIDLTVQAISDPLYPLQSNWQVGNKTYISPDMPPYVFMNPATKYTYINASLLTIEQKRSVAGIYRKIFLNQFQSKTVEIHLYLTPPKVAGFDFWIIGLVLALLLILLIIIICCCVICRRKMQEGDYPVDRKETAAGLDPEKELKESGFPALSRADDPDMEKKKTSNMEIDDGDSMRDDESFVSADYGMEPSAFNEDGSFIGIYKNKPRKAAADNLGYSAGSESNV